MKKNNKLLILSFTLIGIMSIGGLSFLANNEMIETGAWTAPQTSDAGTYYDSVGSETGSALQAKLKSINEPKSTSYDWPRYEAADEAQNSTSDVISIYTRHNINKNNHVGGSYSWDSYNREHIWTQTAYPRSAKDNHNIFACEGKINGIRSNYSFAEVTHAGNEVEVFGHMTGSYFSNPYFEPHDDAKGEVARSVMYGTVQYSYTMTNIIKDIATALKWNIEHPVSDRDNYRNNTVYSLQGNRNPFVDHPEYACRIWGDTNADTKRVCASAPVTDTLKLMVNGAEAGNNQSVDNGKTLTFYAQLNGATTSDVSWTSSNETVASVTTGTVLGLSNGKTTITATYNQDTSIIATCEVTVSDGKVTQIDVSPTSKSIDIGETAQFSATVSPSDALDKTYTWSSSNEAIASISTSGLATANSYGSTTIKATANDGSGVVGAAILTVEKVSSTTYKLITDVSQLSTGRKTAIVASNEDLAMSSTQNTNNRGEVAIVKDTATSTFPYVEGLADLTLENSTTDVGKYCFKSNDADAIGYLYAASSSKNQLKIEDAISSNSSFDITIETDGLTTIKSVGKNTHNNLKYNTNANLFSCYSSGEVNVHIYQATSDPTDPTSIANKYATDFLSATEECEVNASINWATLKTNYNALSTEAKTILTESTYTGISYENATNIQKCVWRYDLAVTKQGLENFMSRGLTLSGAQNFNNSLNNQMWITVLIVCLSIATLGTTGIVVISLKNKYKRH